MAIGLTAPLEVPLRAVRLIRSRLGGEGSRDQEKSIGSLVMREVFTAYTAPKSRSGSDLQHQEGLLSNEFIYPDQINWCYFHACTQKLP